MIVEFLTTLRETVGDLLPIVSIIAFFQLAVIRRPLGNIQQLLWGIFFVLLGLTLFLLGLKLALFPLGESMAQQLIEKAQPADGTQAVSWQAYIWTYVFAFVLGVSTTVAEPALIAVSLKAQEVSGGTIDAFGLRLAVAVGVGLGVSLGTLRIVLGVPLPYFIITAYLIVTVQTYFAPAMIIPLAYDSGGVSTSTVTVPLVTALGLGLAAGVPDRDPLVDGFGLIAFACLFPIISVMAYAQSAILWNRLKNQGASN